MSIFTRSISLKAVAAVAVALLFGLGSVDALAAKPKAKKAKTTKPAVNISALFDEARTAFNAYDFDNALELLSQCREAASASADLPSGFEQLYRQSEIGSNMLTRVEAISVIDSISVDSNDFFTHYRLSPSAGYIADSLAVPEGFSVVPNTPVYATESGETIIWSMPLDSKTCKSTLVQSHLLTDGTWEQPEPLGDAFNSFPTPAYPFMMPDGTTLYFASQGEESLGGFDIFITRNNGDEYLTPQNVGMPYNSPYNDYLLAIDEQTGAGWWATDRGRTDGRITIYIFVPSELRSNYPVDTPTLASLAQLSSISQTPKSPKSEAITEAIAQLQHESKQRRIDFRFAIPGQGVITSMSQLHSAEAKEAMRKYLRTETALYDAQEQLRELRRRFGQGDKSVAETIVQLEQRVDELRTLLRQQANNVIIAQNS